MPSLRGDSIAFARIMELASDGSTDPDGNYIVTECDIDSIEWENDQQDRERKEIANANKNCRTSYQNPAVKYGKIVRIGIIGSVPEIANILTDAPLNVNGTGDVVGNGDTDYACKFTSLEFGVSQADEACQTSTGHIWRIFPKIGHWQINQDEAYTNENNVPVTVYEGYGFKNPNFDDPFGIWMDSPAYLRTTDYTSYALLTETLPTETDGLEPNPS